jgi:hypothetical protein
MAKETRLGNNFDESILNTLVSYRDKGKSTYTEFELNNILNNWNPVKRVTSKGRLRLLSYLTFSENNLGLTALLASPLALLEKDPENIQTGITRTVELLKKSHSGDEADLFYKTILNLMYQRNRGRTFISKTLLTSRDLTEQQKKFIQGSPQSVAEQINASKIDPLKKTSLLCWYQAILNFDQ